jgi:dTMP kinase
MVCAVIDFAVGDTRPNRTLLLMVPLDVSEARRQTRQTTSAPARDRFEEADRGFFERVEKGYRAIAAAEPQRICVIDSTRNVDEVKSDIWQRVERLLATVS